VVLLVRTWVRMRIRILVQLYLLGTAARTYGVDHTTAVDLPLYLYTGEVLLRHVLRSTSTAVVWGGAPCVHPRSPSMSGSWLGLMYNTHECTQLRRRDIWSRYLLQL
jgi:hypothetical protein